MRLSVLIASLDSRADQLARVCRQLREQQIDESMEVLIQTDDGTMPIGTKRNILMSRAQGEYVCFVDDDDLIADNYVERILKATETHPDCVAIEGTIIGHDGAEARKWLHSMQYGRWYERNGVYYRSPTHINPIKRQLALKFPFNWQSRHGEDHGFSTEIWPHIESEVSLIGEPIYFYLHDKSRPNFPGSTRILFKYPTRSRPELFKKSLARYLSSLSGHQKTAFLISIDEDDPTMNNREMLDLLAKLPVDVQIGYCENKVAAVNRDVMEYNKPWEILVVLSDDFTPVVHGFDEVIVNDFCRYLPNFDGVIQYEDGLQQRFPRIVTFPVLGWRFYRQCGYVYHPDYTSEWCDNEMTEVAQKKGRLKVVDRVVAKHEWIGITAPDALHDRNVAFHAQDKEVFLARQRQGFPP